MNRIQEFWYCVASQDDLPLYKGHSISSDVCNNLITFIDYYKSEKLKSKTLKEIISEALLTYPAMIKDIRLLLGISDKRLYLDLTYLVNFTTLPDGTRLVDESRENLTKHSTQFFINQLKRSSNKKEYAELISNYFLDKNIEEILKTFSKIDNRHIVPIFNNLIAPKEIQQKQAKYRGHGAEMEFAKVFYGCGVEIFPENKHTDPMASYDPNVDLSTMDVVSKDITNANIHTFDLIRKDSNNNIKILVQSLIHSSDPGQFGVDKSNETIAIKNLIDEYNISNPEKKVYLLGSVDGVGFSENLNGTIIKMLDVFDEFFQMNTLFKIGIFLHKIKLINNLVGVKFDEAYFGERGIAHFEEKYLKPLNLLNLTNTDTKSLNILPAGKGSLIFKK